MVYHEFVFLRNGELLNVLVLMFYLKRPFKVDGLKDYATFFFSHKNHVKLPLTLAPVSF